MAKEDSKQNAAATKSAIATEDKKTDNAPPWSYSQIGKKNPFQVPPGLSDGEEPGETTSGKQIQTKRIKEFLESFQLDSLKLVATIFQIEDQPPVAMVEDPMGVGHVVQSGRFLGANEGRIKEIQDGRIIIEERVSDKNAPQPTRIVTLKLSKEVAP
ncbi:MAG: hypothetical protein HW380_126 [Magnetococcales bacterium]|nr:hypothetical protein [Magnetococcales bacterium]